MRHARAIQYLELGETELSAGARNRLDRHLAGCQGCRLRAREAVSLGPILAQLGSELPAGFEQALDRVRRQTMRAVQAEAQRAPAWSWLPRAVPAVAAAGLLVGLLVSFGTGDLLKGTSQGSRTSIAPNSPSQVAGHRDSAISSDPVELLPIPSQASQPVSGGSLEGRASKANAAVAPGRVRRPRSGAGSPVLDFMIVKSGAEVRIEWLNDRDGHLVRKAEDPVGARYAMAEKVVGNTWRDPGRPEPSMTVYYLVD